MSEENTELDNRLGWYENLPEEIKTAPYFKDVDGVQRTTEQIRADLDGAASLQGNMSKTHLRIPGEDAAPEAIEKWRERVLTVDPNMMRRPGDDDGGAYLSSFGVPNEAGGYEVPAIEGYTPENIEALKAECHGLCLNQEQFNAVVANQAALQASGLEGQTEWKNQQSAAVNEVLGLAREERLGRAAKMLRDSGQDALAEALTSGALPADVVLGIDTLVNKAVELGAEKGQFQSQSHAVVPPTPDEISERLREINDKLRGGMDERHPDYKRLMAARADLYTLRASA